MNPRDYMLPEDYADRYGEPDDHSDVYCKVCGYPLDDEDRLFGCGCCEKHCKC